MYIRTYSKYKVVIQTSVNYKTEENEFKNEKRTNTDILTAEELLDTIYKASKQYFCEMLVDKNKIQINSFDELTGENGTIIISFEEIKED